MSTTIDNRVVEMQFENSQFEKGVSKSIKSIEELKKSLKFDEATESLNQLQKAGDSFSLAKIADAAEDLAYHFSWMGRTVSNVLDNITYRATSMVKSLSVDQITSGWTKYADKTAYVQTIMNATGKSIDEVNGYLSKLMWFSDETSYSFVDMTQALGTLTSSGGDIDKLIPMLEGMANATSFAGKSAAEFSRTMYNLNQSYSAGYMQYIDWKSVEMAGVGSEQLKQAFIDAGIAEGKLTKEAKTTKGTLVSIANFGSTLNEKWADTKVMERAFGTFSEMTEKAYELIQEGKFDTASEAYEYLSTQYTGIGITAAKAAQEAKSFNEAIAATTDAVSSGWMNTFELIFGNYDEAKVMWTDLANWLWDVFASGAEARNELLQTWKDLGGRTAMLEGIYSLFDSITNLIYAMKDAWASVFPETTADQLMDISNGIKSIGNNIKEAFSYETATNVVDQFTEAITKSDPLGTFWGEMKKGAKGDDVKKLQERLQQLGYDIGETGVDGIFGTKTQAALVQFQKDSKIKPTGIFDEKTFNKLGTAISSAFGEHTMIAVGETTEEVTTYASTLDKLRTIAQGAFSVLHIGWTTIKFLAQAAGKVLSVFAPLGNVVLSVFAKLAGVATDADQALSENGFVGALEKLDNFLEPLRQKVQDFADAIMIFFGIGENTEASEGVQKFIDIFSSIKDWWDSLEIVEKLGNAFTAIKGAVVEAWPSVKEFFTTVGDLVGDKVSTGFSMVVDWLAEKIPVAINAVVSAFQWLSDTIKSLFGIGENEEDNPIKETVDGFTAVFYDDGETESKLDKAKSFIEKIKEFFTSIWDTVSSFFSGNFAGAFNSLKTTFSSIGAWLNANLQLDGILDGFEKIMDFLSKHAGWIIGGVGIVLLFKLIKFVTGFKDLALAIVKEKQLEAKAEIAKTKDPNALQKLIQGIATSIATIAYAINMLGNMNLWSLIKGITGLAACVAAIIVLTISFAAIQKIYDGINFKEIGDTMLHMGIAIAIVAASVIALGMMGIGKIAQGIIALGMVISMLIGTALAFKKLNSTIKGGIELKGILELAGAIGIMAGLAIILGYMDFWKFLKGLVMLTLATAVMLGFVLAVSKVSNASVNMQLSGLLKISLAIGVLAAVAWIVGNADEDKWCAGFKKMIAVAALMLTFVLAISKIATKSSGTLDIAIKGMLGISVAIAVLAGAAWLLGNLDPEEWKQGMISIGVITAAIIGIIAIMGTLGKNVKAGPIIALGIGLGLIAIALSFAIEKLRDVDWTTIAAFTGSMVVTLVALIIACQIVGNIGAGTMLTGALGIAGAFAIIVAILGALVAGFGAIDKLMNGGLLETLERGGDIMGAIGSAVGKLIGGLLSGIINPIADSIHALGTGLKEISSVQDLPGTLEKAISAITILTVFIKSIETEGIETNPGALGKFFFGENKTNSLLEQIANLGGTIKVISEALGGVGKTDLAKQAENAVSAITSIKDFIISLQDVSVDYVSTGIAQWFMGQTKTEYILGLIESFGDAMSSTATALSTMPTNASTIASEATEAATTIVGFIGTLSEMTDVETPSNIFKQWFVGETKEEQILGLIELFGDAMSSTATTLSTMPNNAVSLANDATAAADTILAFIQSFKGRVNVTDYATIFGDWFGGESYEETVLGLIEQFGTSMQAVTESLNSVSTSSLESATQNAVDAAQKVIDFLPELAKIDTTKHINVFTQWFSGATPEEQVLTLVEQFGTSLRTLTESLTGVDTSIESPLQNGIDAAVKVCKFLEDLGSYDIESKKSAIAAWFTGETKTETVIDQIGDMGTSMKTLADTIPDISKTSFSSDIDAMINAYDDVARFINMISADDFNVEIEGKMSELKSDMKMLGEGVVDFFNAVNAGEAQGLDVDAVTELASSLSGSFNLIASIVANSLSENCGSLGYDPRFLSVGKWMTAGIAQGMKDNLEVAKAAAAAVALDVLQAAKDAVGISSPSKKFAEVGMYCDAGWAKGIDKSSGLVSGSVEDMSASALNSARGSLSGLADVLMNDMDADPVIRPVVDMSNVNKSANQINGLVSGSRAMNIDTTVAQTGSVSRIMSRSQLASQNGSTVQNTVESTNPLNISGNNFYIRSDNDIKMLANELATLTKKQQRSLGAAY